MHLGFTLLLFTAHAMKTTTTASATSVSVPFPQWWIVSGYTQFKIRACWHDTCGQVVVAPTAMVVVCGMRGLDS